MARRGVEFVVFGDVGVISDAAVARHRLCKRGACVVDERIRRDAGRREAMVNVGVCKVCNEETVLGAATISHQLFDSALEIPATAPPLFLRKRRNSFVTNASTRRPSIGPWVKTPCRAQQIPMSMEARNDILPMPTG